MKRLKEDFNNMFKDKNILVTGGTGAIGSNIVKQLLNYEPSVIRVYSRNETRQFEMEKDLGYKENVRYLIGDVRDKERLTMAGEDIDYIFHTAGLKHVPACEYNPFEAVKTNVIGTQNLIESAIKNKIKKLIFTCTDKAANPTNTMGATKLLAERLISSANYYKGKRNSLFASVRFGNVMGTSGSVIPLFIRQISRGGPVTVTEPTMTRFMMSISEAVKLVFKATSMAKGGEVFIFKMPTVKLMDLAEVLIEEFAPIFGYLPSDIPIEVIGLRPGEKMYEELLTGNDAVNAYETDDMFIIKPQLPDKTVLDYYKNFKKASNQSYSSDDEKPLTKDELLLILKREGIVGNDKNSIISYFINEQTKILS